MFIGCEKIPWERNNIDIQNPRYIFYYTLGCIFHFIVSYNMGDPYRKMDRLMGKEIGSSENFETAL